MAEADLTSVPSLCEGRVPRSTGGEEGNYRTGFRQTRPRSRPVANTWEVSARRNRCAACSSIRVPVSSPRAPPRHANTCDLCAARQGPNAAPDCAKIIAWRLARGNGRIGAASITITGWKSICCASSSSRSLRQTLRILGLTMCQASGILLIHVPRGGYASTTARHTRAAYATAAQRVRRLTCAAAALRAAVMVLCSWKELLCTRSSS